MNLVLVSLGLIALAAATGLLGRYVPRIPLPLLQVATGTALGASSLAAFQVSLDPALFLLLFVPPLLFADGWRLPKREAFHLRGQILLHAFPLVLITVSLIGWLVHWLRPDIPMWTAFALGAVLSPTDAVAVSAITSRSRMPRALLHVLQGEALLNDASGLVALKFSLLASIGAFSFGAASVNMLLVSFAGVGIGVLMAHVYGRVRAVLASGDGSATIPLLLFLVLLPFGAYLLAEAVHASGILAAAAAGITMSYADPKYDDNASLRLQSDHFFGLFTYVLNGVIFLVLGLQLPGVVRAGIAAAGLRGQGPWQLVLMVVVVTMTLLAIRLAWSHGAAAAEHGFARLRAEPPLPAAAASTGSRILLAHAVAGVRGAVTLAAAISLPLAMAVDRPFPARDELIMIAAGVIVLTLLIATICLPWLLRDFPEDEERVIDQERADAAIKASHAAINALASEPEIRPVAGAPSDVVQTITAEYEQRIDAVSQGALDTAEVTHDHLLTRQARLVGLRAEREELHRLHASGEINDETLRELMKPLDLAEESLR